MLFERHELSFQSKRVAVLLGPFTLLELLGQYTPVLSLLVVHLNLLSGR